MERDFERGTVLLRAYWDAWKKHHARGLAGLEAATKQMARLGDAVKKLSDAFAAAEKDTALWETGVAGLHIAEDEAALSSSSSRARARSRSGSAPPEAAASRHLSSLTRLQTALGRHLGAASAGLDAASAAVGEDVSKKTLGPAAAAYRSIAREIEQEGDTIMKTVAAASRAAHSAWREYAETATSTSAAYAAEAEVESLAATSVHPTAAPTADDSSSSSSSSSAADASSGAASAGARRSSDAGWRLGLRSVGGTAALPPPPIPTTDPWLAELWVARCARGSLAARRGALTDLGRLFEKSRALERKRGESLAAAAELIAEVVATLTPPAAAAAAAAAIAAETASGLGPAVGKGDSLSAVRASARELRLVEEFPRALEHRCAAAVDAALAALEARLRPARALPATAAAASSGATVDAAAEAEAAAAESIAMTLGHGGLEPAAAPAPASSALASLRGGSSLAYCGLCPADVPSPLRSALVVRWGRVEVLATGIAFMRRWNPGIAVLTVTGFLHVFRDGEDVATRLTHADGSPMSADQITGAGAESRTKAPLPAAVATRALGVPDVFPAGRAFSGLLDVAPDSVAALVGACDRAPQPSHSLALRPASRRARVDVESVVKDYGEGAWRVTVTRPGFLGSSVDRLVLRCVTGTAASVSAARSADSLASEWIHEVHTQVRPV